MTARYIHHLVWFLLLWQSLFPYPLSISATEDNNNEDEDETQERMYDFKKCSGSGCPYMASWLVNVNLFSRAEWWLHSTKMEAASFNIFDKAKFKFQFADPDAYFVHHMSMYEHLNHKKLSFDDAKLKSEILSNNAFHGECANLTGTDRMEERRPYLSLIPFYGGLPPNVTKDRKVHSLGQGNSLVSFHCMIMIMKSFLIMTILP